MRYILIILHFDHLASDYCNCDNLVSFQTFVIFLPLGLLLVKNSVRLLAACGIVQ